MRKILIAVMAVVSMFWFASPTHATLIDRGGGLIYDDDLNITWLQDANYASTSSYDADGRMNWNGAVAWAENLVYFDSVRNVNWSDWRLPTTPGINWGYISEGEMGHLYYIEGITYSSPGPFNNLQSYIYWSGTEYSAYPLYAWYFYFYYGYQGYDTKDFNFYAWAVRPGDVVSAPIPEPATMLLLGSGLAGLGLFRRVRRRHG